MKTILVTGGAGFIGSHLCLELLKRGSKVISLDNYFTGAKANLKACRNFKGFEEISHDVVKPLRVEVDEIYHLACPASPVHYQADPIKTIKTGFLGCYHLLGLAKRLGVKILYTSTSEIYGTPQAHPQTEAYWGNVNPIGKRACYDESKRIGETLFFDYHRRHGVKIKVVRIFNTFGENMHFQDGRVVSNFIVQALQRRPLTIYGDGSQTRSFCYVKDLIHGIIATMETDDAFLGPVNLGNPKEFTINALAALVLKQTHSPSITVHRPLPSDDPNRRKPDISLAKAKLGWSPSTSLEEGLKNSIAYFKATLRV